MLALRHNMEQFTPYHLHDLHVEQVQMDDLFALLRAVKEGEISEAQAIKRLSRSPQWVWTAMDPVSKLILAWDVGPRTQAMAQRLVHQVRQVLAPACVPLFLTDGFRKYLTALVGHYGQWVQPERSQAKGPRPVQTRSRVASATGDVPGVPQLLLASRQLTIAATRDGRHPALATTDAGNGSGSDGPGLAYERYPDVSRATVAAESDGIRDWHHEIEA